MRRLLMHRLLCRLILSVALALAASMMWSASALAQGLPSRPPEIRDEVIIVEPGDAPVEDGVHAESSAYPNTLINQHDFTRGYTGTDVWEVWLCDVKDPDPNQHNSPVKTDLTLDKMMRMLNEEMIPYFSWLSGNSYDLSFVPAGIFESQHRWDPSNANSFQHPDCGGPATTNQGWGARSGIRNASQYDHVSSNGMIVAFNSTQFAFGGGGIVGLFTYFRCWLSQPSANCNRTFPSNARRVFLDGMTFGHGDRGPWIDTAAHEIGHGLEWPHSFGTDKNKQYHNRMDVMSTLEKWPGATPAVNRYAAGWIPNSEVSRHLATTGAATYTLHSPGFTGTQMLTIPGRDTEEFYSLGARTPQKYDVLSPQGIGVEVYRVDHKHSRVDPELGCGGSECYGLRRRTQQVYRDGTSDTNYGHVYSPGDSKVVGDYRFEIIDRQGEAFTVWVGDKDAPRTPSDARATRDSGTQMTVSWSPPSSGSTPTGYQVALRSGTDEFAAPSAGTCSGTLNTASRSCTITGLTAGTAYEVRVRASNADGAGPWAPIGASVQRFAAHIGDSSVLLTWDPPSARGIANEVSGHEVQIQLVQGASRPFSKPSHGTCSATVVSASSTSCTITGLNNGTAYRVRVAAVDSDGAGFWSPEVSVTPKASLPASPSRLAVTDGDGTLTLDWSDTSNPAGTAGLGVSASTVTGHRVSHRTGDNDFAAPSSGTCSATSIPSSTTSCTITGLTNGDWHDIRLRATSSAGDGPWSAVVRARPSADPPAPAGVTVTAGHTALNVNWTAPASSLRPPVVSATVRYRRSDASPEDPYLPACQVNAAVTSCAISGLTNGTSYDVRVRFTATTASSWSTATGTPAPTVPAAPAAPTSSYSTDSALTVSWTAPAANGATITGYTLEHRVRGDDDDGAWTTHSETDTDTSRVINGLRPYTMYQLRVRAANAHGDSAWSASSTGYVTPRVKPGAPTDVTALFGTNSLTVSWSNPPSSKALAHKMLLNSWDGTAWRTQNFVGNCQHLALAVSSCTVTHYGGNTQFDDDTRHRVSMQALNHHGNSTWTGWTEAERHPSFGSSSVQAQQYLTDTAISDLVLPAATSGDGTLTYSLSPAPPTGLTFTPSTRTITGTPTQTTDSAITHTLTATDEDGDTATLTFTLEVQTDTTPSLTTIADQTFIRGTPITTVTLPEATGGNYTITYSLSPAPPAGLTFTPSTRTITGTPTQTTNGAVEHTLTATDLDGDTDTSTFNITVNPDHSPSFGSSSVQAQQYFTDTAISDLVLPAATGGDGTLTYSLSPAPPAGLTFTPSTRTISGTPTQSTGSAITHTLTVTDSDTTNPDSATLTFTLEVQTDTTPSLTTIADQTFIRGTPITTVTLPEATGGNYTITYSLSPALPTGLTFTPSARTITGTPAQVTSGAVTHTLTATDLDGDTATSTFDIAVNPPPTPPPSPLPAPAPAPGPGADPEPVQRRDYFVDDNDSVHHDDINAVAAAGITVGCNTERTRYCPDQPVTRAQMASFLTRALKLNAPTDPTAHDFEDVTDDNAHHDAITAIAAAQITLGCNTERTRYCPDQPVTRAQMASFLTRALKLNAPTDPTAHDFEDVTGDNAHHNDITAIAAAQITLGCNTERTRYCPDQPVTRAQMASFLTRALKLDTDNPA